MSAQSADTNLSEAIRGAEQLDQLGPTAYAQNGPVLVAEIAARAALAEAITNRIRLMRELCDRWPDLESRDAILTECDQLIRSVAHG